MATDRAEESGTTALEESESESESGTTALEGMGYTEVSKETEVSSENVVQETGPEVAVDTIQLPTDGTAPITVPQADLPATEASRMEIALKESGEISLDHARKASQQLEEGNIGAAKVSLAEAEKSAGKHMKKIKYWIERHTVIQEHYQQQERELTANINNVLAKQQSVESQKRSAKTQLGCERSELSRHRSDLSSAEDRLSDAKRRAREANTGKVITGIAAGLLTVFTFGAAAPVAAPLAVGAAGGAIAFGQAEKEAENDIRRCHGRIEDTARKISNIESSISSLSSTISQLNDERSSYMSQRSRLQEEKGKIKDVISFLLDAQKYGSNFSNTTEDCITRTALTGKVAVKAEARGYSLFDSNGTKRVLATFEEAWAVFQEMSENGSSYNFEMDFQCTRCSKSYQQFPHVSSGQLVCFSCHDDLEF